MKQFIVATQVLLIASILSCSKKEDFTTAKSAKLSFSTDTVQFDTVFTTFGSTTLKCKFYNHNNKAIKTNINLAGGLNSFYRLNIDGESQHYYNNYEILPNDSAFIFIEVNIDPQNTNNPMVISDSILFNTNGNEQSIKLIAYGQDVHLFNDSVIKTSTWTADKPYLIYNSIEIAANETLTIEEGVQIHFHNISNMCIKGNLVVEGSVDKKVVFQGDRLEEEYAYYSSQWYGVGFDGTDYFEVGGLFFFPSSTNNKINHAIIKNGAIGIQLIDTAPNNTLKLTLSNSEIFNMSGYGLTAQHSNTYVYNTTIGNCKYNAVGLFLSGHHEFYHTTLANYYEHDNAKAPALFMGNYDANEAYNFSVLFANSIISGEFDNEIHLALDNSNGTEVSLLFDHCMIKLPENFDSSNLNIFKNLVPFGYPLYTNTLHGNYRLDTLSKAIDKGSIKIANLFPIDKDGNNRTKDEKPDLGAYEFIDNR